MSKVIWKSKFFLSSTKSQMKAKEEEWYLVSIINFLIETVDNVDENKTSFIVLLRIF